MTNAQRTPGPWTFDREFLVDEISCGFVGTIWSPPGLPDFNDGKPLALATIHTNLTGNRHEDTVALANAAFIVRACNCHDELVAACELALRRHDSAMAQARADKSASPQTLALIDREATTLRLALSKAQGAQQ